MSCSKTIFTVAIRNLIRRKLYTFIKVFGLGLGIACCILMALFIKHEWTHDWFHENRDQIFRVVMQRVQSDGKAIPIEAWDTVHPPWIVDALKSEVPGVVAGSAFMYNQMMKITKEETTFQHKTGIVSTDFLTMFTFPLLAGDPKTALNQPDGMVINETTARKFFKNVQDYSTVIGQSLTMRNRPFVVTGVMQNTPVKSSLQFDSLVSAEANKNFGPTQKKGVGTVAEIYLQIADGNAFQVLENLNRWPGKERLVRELFQDTPINFILQPLTDVYWNTDIPNHFTLQGNPTVVYVLWVFAGLILFIACSNFITLSVAESSGRAMEVGLRKVMGAKSGQIIQQFWSEALLLGFLGLLLGIAVAEVLLPVFNEFVNKELSIAFFDNGFLLLLLLGFVGLIAGSYPAIVLLRLQPVLAMKGEARIGGRNRFTRILIILQYTISITLMIGTGVMIQQQDYVRNKDLGFNKEQVAIVQVKSSPFSAALPIAKTYKQEIIKDPRVAGVTISDRILIDGYSYIDYSLPDGRTLEIRLIGIDEDYLSTLEIPLVEGRNFSENHPSDRENSVLINETLAKQLGVKNPVGKILIGFHWEDLMEDPVIIGVVRDFHTESLHNQIVPVALQMRYYKNWPTLLIRMRPDRIFETIEMLKNTWEKVRPNVPFSLRFLDERLNQQYRNEIYWYRVLSHSALVVIVLSCLGLFGLASLAVARRTKEVAIRKVFGATMSDVMWLLSKDFVKLLFIASVIAWPIAYWAMNQWLATFAYRIELGMGVFILVGALTLVITLLTVNVQTLKAARSNSVDILRNE